MKMAEAAECARWDHTAFLLAKIHNVNCVSDWDKIRDPFTLNPIRMAQAETLAKPLSDEETARVLVEAFVKPPGRM